MAEYDFLEMLPDVLIVEARMSGTRNGYPNPDYAAAKSYPCQAEAKPRLVRTVDGNERVSSAQMIVATDWLLVNGVPTAQAADQIGVADRVTLPNGLGQQPILYVEFVHDDKGLHHTVVYC